MSVTGYLWTWHDNAEASNIFDLFLQSYDKTVSADGNLKVWIRIDYEYIWKWTQKLFFFCMHAWCLKFPRMKIIFVVDLLAGIFFFVCVVWPLIHLHYSFLLFGHFFTVFLSSSSYLEDCFETSHSISFNLFHIPLIIYRCGTSHVYI